MDEHVNPASRNCANCGKPLSRYNKDDYCGPCAHSDSRPADARADIAPPADLGARLRTMRERRGMTLETLGGLCGVTGAYICMIETGKRRLDRYSMILNLANALRVPPSELTGGPDMKGIDKLCGSAGTGKSEARPPERIGSSPRKGPPDRSMVQEKREFRAGLRGIGMEWREVAAEFGRVYQLRPRTAWREAHGWTLREAADRINSFCGETGIDDNGTSAMTAAHLCEYEKWPGTGDKPTGRKPYPALLAILASLYGAQIHDLLDLADRAHYPKADLLIIDNHVQPAVPAGTPPRPDHLPAHVAGRPDFLEACKKRDLGAIFAIAIKYSGPGFTASHIARRCEMTVSQVGDYVKQRRQAREIQIFERVSDGLHIPGDLLGVGHRPWEPAGILPAAADLKNIRDIADDDDSASAVTPLQTEPFDSQDDKRAWQMAETSKAGFRGIDDMNRRELLRIMTMVGALTVTASFSDRIDWERVGFAGATGKADSLAIDDLAALTDHLWRVFVLSRTKQAVFPLVRDHLDMLVNALQTSGSAEAYRRLCGCASSAFQLCGEVLFDGNLYTEAAHCYLLAATAGREAGINDLWACALTRHAFIGLYEQRFDKAAPLLNLAERLASDGDQTLATRHWIAAVKAQAFAGLGHLNECQRALEAASKVHELDGDFHNGGWLRFDGSRLAEERGTCYVQLGRFDLAESALTDALEQHLSPRRRGGVLVDLAILGIQKNDLNQMLTYADAASRIIQQTGSGYVARKLVTLQSYLRPFMGDSRIKNLNEQISIFASPARFS